MPETNTVYIVDEDSDFSQSAKSLLESYSAEVRVCPAVENFIHENKCSETDIVILDLHRSAPADFQLLNRLISTDKRPAILLFTTPKSAVKRSDKFIGERVFVLEHPIIPTEFMSAIQMAFDTFPQ